MNAGIFISHIAEDKFAGLAIKDLLRDVFGNEQDVFVSSDYDSIRSGADWHGAILEALGRSGVVLVLCHEGSVNRAWVNYEAGAGDGQGSLVVPCVMRHFSKGSLKPPISRKQARDLADLNDLKALLRDIGNQLKKDPKEVSLESFLELILSLRALSPDIRAKVSTFIARRTGLNDQLQFALMNESATDVELIQFKVMIPDRILDPAWPRHGIPPISGMEQSTVDGESRTVATCYVTDSPIGYGYPPDAQRLPRYLAGKATVTLRDFRFPLIREIAERHRAAEIRYELALRGAPIIRGVITLRELLERPARDL